MAPGRGHKSDRIAAPAAGSDTRSPSPKARLTEPGGPRRNPPQPRKKRGPSSVAFQFHATPLLAAPPRAKTDLQLAPQRTSHPLPPVRTEPYDPAGVYPTAAFEEHALSSPIPSLGISGGAPAIRIIFHYRKCSCFVLFFSASRVKSSDRSIVGYQLIFCNKVMIISCSSGESGASVSSVISKPCGISVAIIT